MLLLLLLRSRGCLLLSWGRCAALLSPLAAAFEFGTSRTALLLLLLLLLLLQLLLLQVYMLPSLKPLIAASAVAAAAVSAAPAVQLLNDAHLYLRSS